MEKIGSGPAAFPQLCPIFSFSITRGIDPGAQPVYLLFLPGSPHGGKPIIHLPHENSLPVRASLRIFRTPSLSCLPVRSCLPFTSVPCMESPAQILYKISAAFIVMKNAFFSFPTQKGCSFQQKGEQRNVPHSFNNYVLWEKQNAFLLILY